MDNFLNYFDKFRLGLLRKISGVAVVATLILVSAFAIVDWNVQLLRLRPSSNENAHAISENLAFALRHPLMENRLDVLQDILCMVIQQNNYAGIRILLPSGKVFSMWHPSIPRPSESEPDPEYIEEKLRATAPQQVQNPNSPMQELCKIVIFTSASQEFSHLLSQVQKDLIKSLILSLTLALIIALLFNRFLIRPLEVLRHLMAKSAAEIRTGELHGPHNIPNVRETILRLPFHFGEIDRMSESFSDLTQAVKDRQLSILKSENDLSTILTAIGDGVLVVDTKGCITHINPAMIHILDLSQEMCIGQHFRGVINIVNQQTGLRVPSTLERVLKTGEKSQHDTPVILFTHDDTKRYVESLSTPLFNMDGELTGAVMVVHDKTDKIMLETQIKNVQKMEVVGRIAGGLAHDLNNMITGISGASELLTHSNLSEVQNRHVKTIQNATQNVSALVQQLLGFSRQDDKAHATLNLHNLLNDTVALIQPIILNVTFTLRFIPGEIQILGDTTQVQNMFLNLLINAKDAMPNGGELIITTEIIELKAPQITRSGLPLQFANYAKTTVEDNGTGIPDGVIERIFEPFYTTKPKGKGTGLGLSIVFSTLEEMHGAVDVQTVPGRGTTFIIYIPLESYIATSATESISIIPATSTSAMNAGTLSDSPVPNIDNARDEICVMDQDRLIRQLTFSILFENNFKVTEILDFTAPEIQNLKRCQLLISDLTLLESPTPQILNEMRAIYGHFPVLVCTGIDLDDQRLVAILQLPDVYYLQKPYTCAQILNLIHQILTKYTPKTSHPGEKNGRTEYSS